MPKFHEFTDHQERTWTVTESDDGRIAIECDRVASMESQDHALGGEIIRLKSLSEDRAQIVITSRDNWIMAEPTSPGYYWFWPIVGEPEIREVVEWNGRLIVKMDISAWAVGPDPRIMAMGHRGRWQPIPRPQVPTGVVH